MNINTFKAMIVKEDDGKYMREIGKKNLWIQKIMFLSKTI
jgi:hypothetical protein